MSSEVGVRTEGSITRRSLHIFRLTCVVESTSPVSRLGADQDKMRNLEQFVGLSSSFCAGLVLRFLAASEDGGSYGND